MRRALELAEVGPADSFVDLGCGDGFILQLASSTGAKVTGLEVDPQLAKRAGLGKTKDLFEQDLSPFTVIYCYLSAEGMRLLKPKLMREARPGCRIISLWFPVERWVSWRSYKEVVGRDEHRFYIYRVPDAWELVKGCGC